MSDDPRYGKGWHKTRERTRAMIKGQCTFCMTRENIDVHHAYYGKRGIFGHVVKPNLEIPGWSVFPLCQRHHSNSEGMAHDLDNYVVTKSPWTNHSTSEYLWKLRFRFWLKYCMLGLVEVMVGFVCMFIVFRLIVGFLK